MARIIATADIGSNTAHLLVARTDGATLTRLVNRNDWIALGEVVARQGKIPSAHVARIVATLKTFRTVASKSLAESIYVFATEAMRAASNHTEVMRTVKEKTGLNVKLITPQQEAFLGLRGVMLDVPAKQPALLLEVGGGSAQIAHVIGPKILQEVSLPIGTGRLIAGADMRNPCPLENVVLAEALVDEALGQCPRFEKPEIAVASGGVGRGLWRAVHPDGERRVVRQEVEYLAWATARMSGDRIASRFGVGIRRAETLLPGALVFRKLLDHFGFEEMIVSEYGVREGAALEVADGKIKAQTL
jgi:exopolyphosphatase/guanosine-5'-triphosphate,3'-diphosphate pyrophosphatase